MLLFLFDIDGTLIKSGGSGRISANKSFEKIFNKKAAFDNVPLMGRTDIFIWKYVIKKEKIPYDTFLKLKPLLLKEYYKILEIELKRNKNGRILPYVQESLEYLSIKHFHLGLITGNYKKSAYLKLKRFKLDKYFPIGGFANDGEKREIIAQKAINRAKKYYKINFKKSDIYIIGDTKFDIEAAKKVGVKSIGVATGGTPKSELKKYKPELLLNNLKEIMNYF